MSPLPMVILMLQVKTSASAIPTPGINTSAADTPSVMPVIKRAYRSGKIYKGFIVLLYRALRGARLRVGNVGALFAECEHL